MSEIHIAYRLDRNKDLTMQKLTRIMIVIITSCVLVGCPTKPNQSNKQIKTPRTDNTLDCAKG